MRELVPRSDVIEEAELSSRFSFPFFVVAYVLMVLVLGANVPTPLYGLYGTKFDFTSFTQTAVFAVYAAGLIPALLFFGPLSDRLGRRFVLLSATVVAICSALVMTYAGDLVWLFVGRTLQGVSIGAVSAAGVAALTEYEPNNDRSRAAVTATLATVLGAAVGPLFGGVLAQYLEPSLRVPYIVFLGVLVPGVIALLFLPDRRREHGRGLKYFNRPRIPDAIRRVFWLVSLRVAVVWGAVGLFQSIIPAWVAATLGISNLVLVGGVASLVMVMSVMTQFSAARLEPPLAQRFGLGAIAGGMIALLVVNYFPTPAALLVSVGLVGIGHGLVFAGGMRELNLALAVALQGNDASVIAAFLTVNYAGMAVPSMAAGLAVTVVGFPIAVAALTIVGVLLSLLGLTVSVLFAADKMRGPK